MTRDIDPATGYYEDSPRTCALCGEIEHPDDIEWVNNRPYCRTHVAFDGLGRAYLKEEVASGNDG